MIADKTLLIFEFTAMLKTERFPRTNNDWEDRDEPEKTWAEWKAAYKRELAKARVKEQANEDSVKFCAANAAERVETKNTTHEVETNHGVDKGGMADL